MKKKGTNDFDLTEDEVAVLRSAGTPDEVKRFVARQHDRIGARAAAYRKVAAAAEAEIQALLMVRRLEMVRLDISDVEAVRRTSAAIEQEARQLAAENNALREDLMRARALPAQVVHSDG